MKKYTYYKVGLWSLIVISIVVAALVVTPLGRFVDPYVGGVMGSYIVRPSLSQKGIVGGTAVVIVILSGVSLRFVTAWHWEAIGQEVGLTPVDEAELRESIDHDDDAMIGQAILAGTRDDRTVRARRLTVKSKQKGSGEGGTNSRTYTLIEADLREPAKSGALVSRGDRSFRVNLGDSGEIPTLGDRFGDLTAVEQEPFVAQTNDGPSIRDVLAGRARNELLELASFELLLVGDSEAVYAELFSNLRDSMPEVGGFSLGSMFPSGTEIAEKLDRSDAMAVTHQLEDALTDVDELDRQIDAVVAVADAFERAEARARQE